jgi:hypothetical protein
MTPDLRTTVRACHVSQSIIAISGDQSPAKKACGFRYFYQKVHHAFTGQVHLQENPVAELVPGGQSCRILRLPEENWVSVAAGTADQIFSVHKSAYYYGTARAPEPWVTTAGLPKSEEALAPPIMPQSQLGSLTVAARPQSSIRLMDTWAHMATIWPPYFTSRFRSQHAKVPLSRGIVIAIG